MSWVNETSVCQSNGPSNPKSSKILRPHSTRTQVDTQAGEDELLVVDANVKVLTPASARRVAPNRGPARGEEAVQYVVHRDVARGAAQHRTQPVREPRFGQRHGGVRLPRPGRALHEREALREPERDGGALSTMDVSWSIA